MNKEEIKHFKSILRESSLRHMNILLDDKFQKELLTIIKDYEKLQQENKQLKEKLDYDLQWAFKYDKLVGNWNKLKEWVNKHYDYYMNNEDYIGGRLCFTDIKNKMQEIEQ